MKIVRCEQHSIEWWDARLGVATGSKMNDILGFLKKGGESQARANYRAKIVAELVTQQQQMDGYLSPEMEWGTDQEPLARAAYEIRTGNDVDQVGFMLHDTIPLFGGSADGLVGDDGGIEIKCPKTSTHLRWMLEGEVPEEHRLQMYSYMALSGRKWFDFISFDPRLPLRHQLFIMRLERDEAKVKEIEDGVKVFLAEVQWMIAQINDLNPQIETPVKPDVMHGPELGITDADTSDWMNQHFPEHAAH